MDTDTKEVKDTRKNAETIDMEIEAEKVADSRLRKPGAATRLAEYEPGPRVAREPDTARALLEYWEYRERQRDDGPRPVYAAANFFFPFLLDNDTYQAPHIALWEYRGHPAGILIGRIRIARPQRSIGPLRIPMPKLKTLEILHGGLESRATEITYRQLEYLRQLLATAEVDCIAIHHLPLDSEIGARLNAGLRNAGDGNPVRSGRWLIELTDAGGQPLTSNSAKTRSSFRRQDRKLEEAFAGQVYVRELRNPEDVSGLIDIATAISNQSYHGSMGVGVSNSEHWRRTLSILAANGNLRGYLLHADGIDLAYGIGAVYHGTFNAIATAFLPEYRAIRPGTFLLRRTIERLQEEGVRWFDFGYGGAAYKELYGTQHSEEATFHLYARSPAATIAGASDALVQGISHGTRRLLASAGMLDRIRQLWRRRLERPGR
ncbi:GNAT family N-acetyltransferase [Microbulbifer bruguierae]|uniref:GNAT family N-acetyltransferase n=1 Tax=Microbulbifer bruguierae TaxID=3029061 RepID=A0ABY8NLL7_9GAMM|nr:GNAT family N-acetyltransferase [Microbulbifer bruguierae]WGL18498.1 GNAT family N-acetyltransferase [Microbulbifer bruguierae]